VAPAQSGISHLDFKDYCAQQGGIRFKSGANNSWLEATPTIFIHHFPLYVLSTKDMWERHLAAIFEHFEPG
jgi:hypothetical protein